MEEPGPGCLREQLISGGCLPCQEMAVALKRGEHWCGCQLLESHVMAHSHQPASGLAPSSGLRDELPCSQRAEGNAHKGGRIRAGVAKAQGTRWLVGLALWAVMTTQAHSSYPQVQEFKSAKQNQPRLKCSTLSCWGSHSWGFRSGCC